MQKSIDSNDTTHSDGSVAAQMTTTTTNTTMTTTANSNSNSTDNNESGMRENGNGVTNNDVSHVHSTGNGSVAGANNEPRLGLNLKMSAKELRAQLAARKKYDPKKESIGFKDKFDIVQKL